MPARTTSFTVKDFEQRGVFNQSDSECQIDDLLFRKSSVYENKEIKQVLDICKKHNSLGFNILVVRSMSDLTIWVEKKSQPSAKKDRPPADKTQTDSQATPSLPTKTITKKYRGQVYEETVVDWAAVAMQKQGTQTEGKVRRKYRGNYID